MKKIAIIPARGGSKRIPGKNIKDFCGKPLIAYSIEAAVNSKLFDLVLVSTDSSEIKKIALEYGAEVPFERSGKNSDDFATTADVIFEVLGELKKNNKEFEFVCCLYPTAPMVTAAKLQESFNSLIENDANSVVPVVKFGYPIQRALILNNGELKFREEEFKSKRSQDLQEAFHDSGQFYWIRTPVFLNEKSLFTSKCFPMILSELEVQDIDTLEDLKIAEFKYKLLHGRLN